MTTEALELIRPADLGGSPRQPLLMSWLAVTTNTDSSKASTRSRRPSAPPNILAKDGISSRSSSRQSVRFLLWIGLPRREVCFKISELSSHP